MIVYPAGTSSAPGSGASLATWSLTRTETMRTLLTAFVLTCGLAATAAAFPLSLGVHGGSGIPNLHDNGGNDFSKGYSTRVAPYFGAFADLGLTPLVSVQIEANFAAQGGKRDGLQPFSDPSGNTLYASFKNVAKLDYVEVPVLAKLHLGPDRRLFVDLGPYVGFLLSAKNETSGVGEVFLDAAGTQTTGQTQDFSGTADNKSSLNTLNWGVQGGLGAEQPLGPGRLSLEARVGMGLKNIQKNPDVDGKNITGDVVLALGYQVALGGRH